MTDTPTNQGNPSTVEGPPGPPGAPGDGTQDATQAQAGSVRFATNAETIAGTLDGTSLGAAAVTPAGLKALLDGDTVLSGGEY